jgi:chromate reductase, NAD(P)H dehydrogenase (quinone)
MTRIIAISGSLRKGSFNTALLHTAKELMPTGVELQIASIEGIPLFNEDVEKLGAPAAVNTLKDQFAAADGILISTPEYNNSIPGVLKNAIDWISRPNADMAKVFHGKPFALMGASPSGFGTLNAQTAWLPIIRYFKLRPCFANALYVSAAHEKFDANGKLTDEATLMNLKKFINDFALFAQK